MAIIFISVSTVHGGTTVVLVRPSTVHTEVTPFTGMILPRVTATSDITRWKYGVFDGKFSTLKNYELWKFNFIYVYWPAFAYP